MQLIVTRVIIEFIFIAAKCNVITVVRYFVMLYYQKCQWVPVNTF